MTAKEMSLKHGLPTSAFTFMRIWYKLERFEFPQIKVKVIKYAGGGKYVINLTQYTGSVVNDGEKLIGFKLPTLKAETCNVFVMADLLDLLEKNNIIPTKQQLEEIEFHINECIYHHNGLGDGTDNVDYGIYNAIAELVIH